MPVGKFVAVVAVDWSAVRWIVRGLISEPQTDYRETAVTG